MATEYRSRPSTLLGLSEPYAAYCIDQAVLWAGLHPPKEKKRASLQGT